MRTAVDTAVGALATYRATKLIIDDEILAEPREAVFNYLESHPTFLNNKIAYLLTCPWCVSIYTGAALLALRVASPSIYKHVSEILAFSAVTGLVEENL